MLRSLNLNQSGIGSDCAILLARALSASNPGATLRAVHLAQNSISDNGARALASILSMVSNTNKDVDILLHDQAVENDAASLASNVREFDLRDNLIGTAGIAMLRGAYWQRTR